MGFILVLQTQVNNEVIDLQRLSSENYQSHSKVKTLLHRLFGIDVSIASVNR